MPISTTQLRQNIYKILDDILETGQPVIVSRKGQEIVISPRSKKGIDWDHLPQRRTIRGSIDEIDTIEWATEWSDEP